MMKEMVGTVWYMRSRVNRRAAMTMISVIIGLVGGIWHWLSKPLVGFDPCPANGTCPAEVARFFRAAFGIDDVMFGVVAAIAAFLLLGAALYVLRQRTDRISEARHSN
jgi:hypothetical protein